jgi:hypothetical protein
VTTGSIGNTRAAITLSVEFLRRVKARCALEGTTLSDLVERLLKEWMSTSKVKRDHR